jgi:hypothetical protein
VNDGAKDAFTLFFGDPSRLTTAFVVCMFLFFALTVMILVKKAMRDRSNNRNFDDGDVLAVLFRGLLVLLIFTAIFSI